MWTSSPQNAKTSIGTHIWYVGEDEFPRSSAWTWAYFKITMIPKTTKSILSLQRRIAGAQLTWIESLNPGTAQFYSEYTHLSAEGMSVSQTPDLYFPKLPKEIINERLEYRCDLFLCCLRHILNAVQLELLLDNTEDTPP